MSHRPAPSSPACTDSLDDLNHHDCLMARAKADATRLRNEAIRDFGASTFANFWREASTAARRQKSPG